MEPVLAVGSMARLRKSGGNMYFLEPRDGLRHALDIGITRNMNLARFSFPGLEQKLC